MTIKTILDQQIHSDAAELPWGSPGVIPGTRAVHWREVWVGWWLNSGEWYAYAGLVDESDRVYQLAGDGSREWDEDVPGNAQYKPRWEPIPPPRPDHVAKPQIWCVDRRCLEERRKAQSAEERREDQRLDNRWRD